VLVHLLNGASENPLADFSQINSELALFDERLAEKPQIVVFTKLDSAEAQERWPEVETALKARGIEPMAISAATQQNIRALIQRVFQVVDSLLEEETMFTPDMAMPVYELPEEQIEFTITRESDGFHVIGHKIERAAAMTYWDEDAAILRFQNILDTLGISKALEAAGVQVGDTVFIGEYELEWSE
ncbi:MAG: Obg family GTPase CgtA, partial [Anaerolineae bacterium]|nr:Obg family GTPase CgtA [Anaerolineae bacterium]